MRCLALFLMAFAEADLQIGRQAAAHGSLNKPFPRGSKRQAVGCKQDLRVLRLCREKGGRWYCKRFVLSSGDVVGQVLNLWAKRDMLPAASLQPEINRLKERLHEHDSAATAKAVARSLQKQASDAAKNNGSTAIR